MGGDGVPAVPPLGMPAELYDADELATDAELDSDPEEGGVPAAGGPAGHNYAVGEDGAEQAVHRQGRVGIPLLPPRGHNGAGGAVNEDNAEVKYIVVWLCILSRNINSM